MTLGPDGLVRDERGEIVPPGRSPYDNPDLQPHFDRKKRIAFGRMAQACHVDPTRYGELVRIDPKHYDPEDASSWTHMWGQIALRLPPEAMLRLWNDISRTITEGGVLHPSQNVEGDPFAVFVTGICQNLDGHPQHEEYRQTAVVKTGHRVDQTEGEKIIAYLKAQVNVHTCEVCGEIMTTWQTDHTRVSTFAARPENRNPMMASTIRGSDTP